MAVTIQMIKIGTSASGHSIIIAVSAKTTTGFTLKVTAPYVSPLNRLKVQWFATNDPDILIVYGLLDTGQLAAFNLAG